MAYHCVSWPFTVYHGLSVLIMTCHSRLLPWSKRSTTPCWQMRMKRCGHGTPCLACMFYHELSPFVSMCHLTSLLTPAAAIRCHHGLPQYPGCEHTCPTPRPPFLIMPVCMIVNLLDNFTHGLAVATAFSVNRRVRDFAAGLLHPPAYAVPADGGSDHDGRHGT